MFGKRPVFAILLCAFPLHAEIVNPREFSVGDISDELTDAALFIERRNTIFAPAEIVVEMGEILLIETRYWSASRLVLGADSTIRITADALDDEGKVFIVVDELVTPIGGEQPLLTWDRVYRPPNPTDLGNAQNGTDGQAAGQPGTDGMAGKDGLSGEDGITAPEVTLVALGLEGAGLRIELDGGDGAVGGKGQNGGHGGNGGQGAPARNEVRSAFGLKTAVGCAAGPGRGGDGGNGGQGGAGGPGGPGGNGGNIRLIAPGEEVRDLLSSLTITAAGGDGGLPGSPGAPGAPGRPGGEGPLTSWCGSAGRAGSVGQPGTSGRPGEPGQNGAAGSVFVGELDADRIRKAFGLLDDG